ncbi:hypothetical protein FACS1894160_4350 [Bacteroidia bacterium]|nr:hypothetical protein FACS1894123_11070 [Bacteroidia bacterium]GHV09058.1 hypothetical protein FACS1894160_4350 [Bacteroidia bacterium]
MRTSKDAFSELQHSLEKFGGHLHILETKVPVENQMEFFHYIEKIRHAKEPMTIDEQIALLNNQESPYLKKKNILASLSISGDVKAYRAIESYHEIHDDDWTVMSLLQAKITLESEFSDEKKIFISTGLGGRGEKMRFAGLFKSKRLENFSAYQKELIEKEFSYCLQKAGGQLENVAIENNYFTILLLINIHTNIKTVLEQAINECNQYGDFIDSGFLITNVKQFTEADIQKELYKR